MMFSFLVNLMYTLLMQLVTVSNFSLPLFSDSKVYHIMRELIQITTRPYLVLGSSSSKNTIATTENLGQAEEMYLNFLLSPVSSYQIHVSWR